MATLLTVVCVAAAVLLAVHIHALDNGLARTPPMGWANWNGFGCNYNDSTIRAMADALVSTGMRDLGYKTIIIQECIVQAGHRNASGVLQPDPVKFPFGIPNLVDYIHSQGLKAGIYTDVGPKTCAGYEGSFDHEKIDAETFASWGIDFVEEDSCYHPAGIPYNALYARMRDALNATGRPIVFYMCVQGQENVQLWGPSTGNLWRTTNDICSPGQASWEGVVNNFYGNARYPNVSGPGQWQDPDMLVVGMPGLSPLEWQTHFSLWAISAAPLWAGVDLTTMSAAAKTIFLNAEVIAIDQDPLGKQGTLRASRSMAAPQQTVTLQPCDSAYALPWAFNASDSSVRAADQCLTVESCGTQPGDSIITYDCVGAHGGCPANQQFAVRAAGRNVELVSAISSLCVAAVGGAENVVTQQPCDGSAPTLWTWQSPGKIALGSNTSSCLAVGGPVHAAGQVWARPLVTLKPGTLRAAAVFFNPDGVFSQTITLAFSDAGFDPSTPVLVRDVWLHEDVGTVRGSFSTTVPPHGATMVVLSQTTAD